ncbi:hypothetical protein WH223_18440 [Sphingobacterium sp. MYb382]
MHDVQTSRTYQKSCRWTSFLAILAIFCILLSSCPIKSSIKNFIGSDFPAAQKDKSSAQNGTSFFSNSTTDCAVQNTVKESTFQKGDSSQHAQVSATLLFSLVLAFIYGNFTLDKKQKPHHKNVGIKATIPIFIAYRKLLI